MDPAFPLDPAISVSDEDGRACVHTTRCAQPLPPSLSMCRPPFSLCITSSLYPYLSLQVCVYVCVCVCVFVHVRTVGLAPGICVWCVCACRRRITCHPGASPMLLSMCCCLWGGCGSLRWRFTYVSVCPTLGTSAQLDVFCFISPMHFIWPGTCHDQPKCFR
jgi:hypothetical protein